MLPRSLWFMNPSLYASSCYLKEPIPTLNKSYNSVRRRIKKDYLVRQRYGVINFSNLLCLIPNLVS
jgi:hypothetical protein